MSQDLVLYFNQFNNYDYLRRLNVFYYLQNNYAMGAYGLSNPITRDLLDCIQDKQNFFIYAYNAYFNNTLGYRSQVFDVTLLPYFLEYYNTNPVLITPQIGQLFQSQKTYLFNTPGFDRYDNIIKMLTNIGY